MRVTIAHEVGASALLHAVVVAAALLTASLTKPADGRIVRTLSWGAGHAPGSVMAVDLVMSSDGRPDVGTRGSAGDRSASDVPAAIPSLGGNAPPAADRVQPTLPRDAVRTEDRDARPEGGSAPTSMARETTGIGVTRTGGAESGGMDQPDAGPAADGTSSADGAGEIGGNHGGRTGAASAAGVDVIPPRLRHAVVPALAASAPKRTSSSVGVKVLVHVTAMGEVDDAKVLVSSGVADIDNAALKAAREMLYTPGFEAGAPAAMWTEAELTF